MEEIEMGMLGGEKKALTQGAVDSVIGEKAKFKGELMTEGAVSVNGAFEGKLSAGGEIILSRGSKVMGDVEGGSVVVSGKVDGNISAANGLEITKTGRVNGDLAGGKITIEEGSSYHGRVKVNAEVVEEEIIIEDKPAPTPKKGIDQAQFF
jgi:cytoskeletal protein CcmA (bactofilin family)